MHLEARTGENPDTRSHDYRKREAEQEEGQESLSYLAFLEADGAEGEDEDGKTPGQIQGVRPAHEQSDTAVDRQLVPGSVQASGHAGDSSIWERPR